MATRLQLIESASIRANMDNSGFPTSAQRIAILNEQARSLWSEMVNNDYTVKRLTATISAVSGTTSYSLGVNGLLRVFSVWDYRCSTPSMLRRANTLERSTNYNALYSTTLYDIEIDPVDGPSILLFPTTLTGQFKVEYCVEHPGFIDDSAKWHGPSPSDEVLVLRTAAAMKEKLDPTGAGNLRSEANNRLSELWAVCKSMATPQRMIDLISQEEGWCFEGL